jgi:transposase
VDSLTPYFPGLKEDCFMVKAGGTGKVKGRHVYSEEFRQEAVQMLLDGHSAASVARRLGLSSPTLLYGWKKKSLLRAGPAARTLGDRVHHLEEELRRVERERDILKKALSILSRSG